MDLFVPPRHRERSAVNGYRKGRARFALHHTAGTSCCAVAFRPRLPSRSHLYGGGQPRLRLPLPLFLLLLMMLRLPLLLLLLLLLPLLLLQLDF